ncbi:MAG: hypothetical protein QHC65_02210 [Sphingomonas sp.]|nr:hypothetical protein [Sphingomonas sp.]MDX3883207.1 hypothetical protein [Sphingomonas sp.]
MSENEKKIGFVHDNHIRKYGIWPQYFGLKTRLRGNVFFSDIINPDDQWTDWEGRPANVVDLSQQTPENYHDTHNHYQNVMSEVWNFAPHTNGIAFWGDASAIANDSAAWGGFVSARSSYVRYTGTPGSKFEEALPPGLNHSVSREDFDCQLTGLEVDVINGGKPGVMGNKAKHGITIVGFGNPNSHAVSVICENFDCEESRRRGQFETGVYFQNSIHPDYGRLVVADFDRARIGLDFRGAVFREGAAQFRTVGSGTGIVFNGGKGGEVYAEAQSAVAQEDSCLTIRCGKAGLRILDSAGEKTLIHIDGEGRIVISGEVVINGKVF